MIEILQLIGRKKGDSGFSPKYPGQKTGLTCLAAAKDVGENMPARRLEDRIRYLCRRALYSDGADFDTILTDLRSSLHEHAERLRQIMALRLATRTHTQLPDRRAH
jgi:hypothetical protein